MSQPSDLVWNQWIEEAGYADMAQNVGNHRSINHSFNHYPHIGLQQMSTLPQSINSLMPPFQGYNQSMHQPHMPRSPAPGSMDDLHASLGYGQSINQSAHDPSFMSPLRPSPPFSSPSVLGKAYTFNTSPAQFQSNNQTLPESPSAIIMSAEQASRTSGIYSRHLNHMSSPTFSPSPNINNTFKYQPTPDRSTIASSAYSSSTFTPYKSPFTPMPAPSFQANLNKMMYAGASPIGPNNAASQFLHQPLQSFSPFTANKYKSATPVRDFLDEEQDLSVTLSSYPSLSTIRTDDSPLQHNHNNMSGNMSMQQAMLPFNGGMPSAVSSAQITQSNNHTVKRHFSLTSSPSAFEAEEVEAKPVVKKQKVSRTSSIASSEPAATGRSSPEPPKQIAKGLRHFSMRVCKKVEEIGETTYNAVADELVAELKAQHEAMEPEDETDTSTKGKKGKVTKRSYDEKNVRRRVYDALNVLMAMGIIKKDKKRITWIGLPGGVARHCKELQENTDAVLARVQSKQSHLQELLMYLVALRNLGARNQATMNALATNNAPAGTELPSARNSVPLRFLLIKTHPSNIVHLSVSPDQSELHCDVSGEFMLHSGEEILQLMKLGEVDSYDLASIIPREMIPFYPQDLIRVNQHVPSPSANFTGKLSAGSSIIVGGQ